MAIGPQPRPLAMVKKVCTVSQCKARRGRPLPNSNKSSLGRKYTCLGCSDRALFSPRPGSGSSRPGPAPPRHGSSRTRLVPDLHKLIVTQRDIVFLVAAPYNGHEATLELVYGPGVRCVLRHVSHRIHWGRTPGQVWPENDRTYTKGDIL